MDDLLPALLLDRDHLAERQDENVFCLCSKVCQISSVRAPLGHGHSAQESATKAQSEPADQTLNKRGFREQEVLLSLPQYGPTYFPELLGKAEERMPKQRKG